MKVTLVDGSREVTVQLLSAANEGETIRMKNNATSTAAFLMQIILNLHRGPRGQNARHFSIWMQDPLHQIDVQESSADGKSPSSSFM
jgi:hypothetical protein